ncbi:MAG: cysteine desulfurase [Proteobacteria bacterium]|nr:cysteine desulfurase [Pseudomonadota bacterium]
MIYLDYQATTPLAPEAREAMLPWLAGPEAMRFANPHSAHVPGRAARAAVELAREQVAALLPPGGRVVFTSGASEAINLAIHGLGVKRIALSPIEHAAVIDTARASGAMLDWLPVGADGLVPADAPVVAGTGLVALMQVNNEIGTVQPVAEVTARARTAGALVLCDAVQGAGKLAAPDADLIALSAHKLCGPKGIGALWVRDGVVLAPLIHGGGQEGGLRAGTLSPALCAGFGAAAELCTKLMKDDAQHVDQLWETACALLPDWQLNGSATQRWRGNLSLRRDGLDAARLLSECRGLAISAGSACASGSGRPSHVLQAIGLTGPQAKGSIRLGFGRYTTRREVEDACAMLNAAAAAQGV